MARIVELAEEHPSMLVFARYTGQIELIASALRKKGHNVGTLTGATKDREKVVNESDILVCNVALGEGWEAPRFDFIVFASLPWSIVEWEQSCGRASRANVPKRRTYVTFTCKDSIDEDVKESLDNKKDFNLKLYSLR